MDRFIGLSVKQEKNHTALHLDQYIAETLGEYQKLTQKTVRTKSTPMQPGNVLDSNDAPIVVDYCTGQETPEELSIDGGETSVRCNVGTIRYLICGCTASSILRIGGAIELGGTSPCDGVLV
jgi:hypothetical protein